MPPAVVYIVIGVAVLWFGFRLTYFVLKRIRGRRDARVDPHVTCPQCGSRRLDEYSDEESGHCLECKHVWGVKVP